MEEILQNQNNSTESRISFFKKAYKKAKRATVIWFDENVKLQSHFPIVKSLKLQSSIKNLIEIDHKQYGINIILKKMSEIDYIIASSNYIHDLRKALNNYKSSFVFEIIVLWPPNKLPTNLKIDPMIRFETDKLDDLTTFFGNHKKISKVFKSDFLFINPVSNLEAYKELRQIKFLVRFQSISKKNYNLLEINSNLKNEMKSQERTYSECEIEQTFSKFFQKDSSLVKIYSKESCIDTEINDILKEYLPHLPPQIFLRNSIDKKFIPRHLKTVLPFVIEINKEIIYWSQNKKHIVYNNLAWRGFLLEMDTILLLFNSIGKIFGITSFLKASRKEKEVRKNFKGNIIFKIQIPPYKSNKLYPLKLNNPNFSMDVNKDEIIFPNPSTFWIIFAEKLSTYYQFYLEYIPFQRS